jgi:hypothetical protein
MGADGSDVWLARRFECRFHSLSACPDGPARRIDRHGGGKKNLVIHTHPEVAVNFVMHLDIFPRGWTLSPPRPSLESYPFRGDQENENRVGLQGHENTIEEAAFDDARLHARTP